MSTTRELFLQMVESAAQTADGRARLDLVVRTLMPVLDLYDAGHELAALDLLADLQGRALLLSALPGWSFGDVMD